MIELGKKQTLQVVKTVDFGVYLAEDMNADTKHQVLLPAKQVPAGTKAGADMVGPTFECSVRTTKIVDGKLKTEIENIPEPVDMNAYDINHWIDAIQNDTDPAVLPEQAATVTRVIEAIYESARTGETIHF